MKLHDLVPNVGSKRIENASDVVFLPGRVKPLAVVPKAQVLVLAKVVMPIVRVEICRSSVACRLCVVKDLHRQIKFLQ